MLQLRFAGLMPFEQGRRAFETARLDSGLAAGAPVIAAGVDGLGSQFVFNAQELVVLSHPVTAAERAGLDLAGASGYSQVGNCYVFGFAAAVADDTGVAGSPGKIDGLQRFG